MSTFGHKRAPAGLLAHFRVLVDAWGRKHPGWIACEAVTADIADALLLAGYAVRAVTGEATYFDADEGEPVRDFHAWIVAPNGTILDPKAALLKERGFKHHRYWSHKEHR